MARKSIVVSAIFLAYKFSPESLSAKQVANMLKCPAWMIYKNAPLVRARFNEETQNELEIAKKYIDQQATTTETGIIDQAKRIADQAWHPDIRVSPRRIAASSMFLAHQLSTAPKPATQLAQQWNFSAEQILTTAQTIRKKLNIICLITARQY